VGGAIDGDTDLLHDSLPLLSERQMNAD
jgi:hypothetical protein